MILLQCVKLRNTSKCTRDTSGAAVLHLRSEVNWNMWTTYYVTRGVLISYL